ncbi:hypothetical protein PENPOL_c004G04440 [Penicillium polonicum]|uniref:Uncharacterized protein n=1 Tax=Penicillium polonicum TaxID=60169 RepID=A0A1V6NPM6_PENPO|nr:hypothetical protein PENPOL_c004G04440 [Penicillium polonicum]
MKGFIGGIPVALLAVAAQAQFAERHEHDFHPQAGGTAIGGPSGNDNDGGFVSPYSASIKTDTKVNQWNKDDHSIKLKHTDVYPRPPAVGHAAGHGPQVPGMGPFGKGKRGAPGGTAIGGPSGNDEGQSFDMSVTGVFNTEVEDENKDDHSIDVKNKHVYPAPVDVHPHPHFSGPSRGGYNHPGAFGKRFGPHAGGTAIGGPSGNDGGQSFSAPTNIQTSADVSEHNEDDHSIGLKHEDIYAHPFAPFRRSENHGPAGHGGAPPPGHGGAPPAGHFEPHPESHFEPHPESHFEPHTESHYQPHSEPHYEPHPEPHFENHPEPHVEHHPEPHYEPHYSPTYAPHYEPHHTVEHDLTSLKNNNNGPAAGTITFGRRGFPGRPESHFEPHPENHFEPHPESHYEPHTKSHYEPHSEPHYEPHPEPHFENHPEPHTENHPEPHYAPHYSPSYKPHYEPHTTLDYELTELKNNNNGPSAGSIAFGRRAYAPTPETSVGGGTAIGGPSGNDGGSSFSAPTDIDVDSDVDEHNEDNHAIKGDFTHVHPGASQYAREEQVETPQCAAKVHEVVHTVTKTHYKTAEATHVAYQSAPAVENSRVPDYAPHDPAGADAYAPHDPAGADGYAPHDPSGADAYAPSGPAPSNPAAENPSYGIPAHVPMATPTPGTSAGYSGWAQPSTGADPYASFPQPSTGADPYGSFPQPSTGADPYGSFPQSSTGADPYASFPQPSTGADPYASFPQPSTGADPYGSNPKYSVGANPYSASAPAPSDYAAQRPAYSKIAVHVPMATPASYGAFSQATPSNSMGKMIPTGVSAEQKASPSSSASASVSHGVMFEGGAARLSGGIVSAAAAVMGVLAFIL